MKSYGQIEQEFKRRAAWLQKHCPHTNVVEMPFVGWGGSGTVRKCQNCRKEFSRLTVGIPSKPTTTHSGSQFKVIYDLDNLVPLTG